MIRFLKKLFGHCKHYDNCNGFHSDSATCTKMRGEYYGPERKCGTLRYYNHNHEIEIPR